MAMTMVTAVELFRPEGLEIVCGCLDRLPQVVERDLGVGEAGCRKIGQSPRDKLRCSTRALDLPGERRHVRRQPRAKEDAHIKVSRFAGAELLFTLCAAEAKAVRSILSVPCNNHRKMG